MYADLHCDTLGVCFAKNTDLNSNVLHITKKSLEKFSPSIQTFAMYIPEKIQDKFGFFQKMLENSLQIVHNTDNLHLYRQKSDIEYAKKNNKTLAVLSVEGGNFFGDNTDENIARVDYLEQNHICFLSLCYNSGSALIGGVDSIYGATPLGLRVADLLSSRGISIDVSHLNHLSTADILATDLLAVATHSNCYTICKHKRNLTDANIIRLIEKQSLIGLNLYAPFIKITTPAKIADLMAHVQHIISLGGKQNIAFGADFDGCDELPCEINSLQDIGVLIEQFPDTYENVKKYLMKI